LRWEFTAQGLVGGRRDVGGCGREGVGRWCVKVGVVEDEIVVLEIGMA